MRSLDWLPHLYTQSYQQRKVSTTVTHVVTVILWWIVFLISSLLCREIFVGACPWTIWRFTCSNSSVGCMYIFCKYVTTLSCTVCWKAVLFRLLDRWVLLYSHYHSSWLLLCNYSNREKEPKKLRESHDKSQHPTNSFSFPPRVERVFMWSQNCRWDYY